MSVLKANKARRLPGGVFLAACAAVLGGPAVAADAPAGALEALTGYNVNNAQFMKDWNLKLGGWLNSSVSANFNGSSDGFNGPVTFNDRTGEIQVNQFYVYLQRAVTASADTFDIGGRVDFMYGTDAIFTQAYGAYGSDRGHWDLQLTPDSERFYGIALPQAYAEFNLPVGNGLTVKAGHFYTPIGYEVVTAPDNFFVTKPYTMQYGEPFTHTGILGSYAFNGNWSAQAGAVTGSTTGGWDGSFDRDLGNWAFLGGATWTSDDANTSATVTSTVGRRAEDAADTWALYSVVLKHNVTDKLHWVGQHDNGFAEEVLAGGGNARWYGINQYLFYDVRDDLSFGIRGEWFRDDNGYRVAGPGRCFTSASRCGVADYAAYTTGTGLTDNSYYAVTVGASYKPTKWLSLRPNVRYDWVDNTAAFDGGTRNDQVLFSADAIVLF